ncbi:MAG: Serine/threonine protein [Planctomycetota bacterium]|nr:MAG: Serine/threonine protein [Planctomycetota bacterium]
MGERDMQTAVQCKKCGKSYSAGVVNNDFQGLCPSCVAAFAFEDLSQSPLEPPGPITPPPDYDKTTMYLKPGTQFQGVVIESVLGQGGMGVVYKARQIGLDRAVALKVMSDRLAGDPDFVRRFEKEAKAMASLSHANIVAVYNYGIDNGRCFIVMEYMDGVNLRQILREKKLRPEEGLRIVPQLCDALEYAHSEGVVHRDIKPENILIDKKGRVKITDFGLAKMVELGRNEHTVTGLVMGTPHYMAPEQVDTPKTVDHRADIYSMGVVFYELLTGELPIGRWQLPSHRNGVDARLDQVVLRALEREPDKRYQHASEMKLEVSRVQEFIPVARLVSAQATGIAVSGAFSSPLAPPGIVSAPSPANPGVVNISSPAAANAGWNAPAGFAPIRPNTPVNPSRMSGWVGTGFGLTIAAVVLAFAGLIVATSKYNSGHAPMAALICTFGLGAVLGSFGFLCNTIGLFDILFNTGRRHGFGLAVMTYAMDLLWLALGGMAFFIGEKPMAEGVVEKRISGPSAVTLPARAAILDSDAHVPPGWALALESRNYETPQELALLWKTSGIPPQAEARRARRLAYVTPNDGPMLFVTAIELRPGADAGEALRAESNHFDSESVGNMLVLYEASPRNRTLDREGYLEVRSWVEENLQRSASR